MSILCMEIKVSNLEYYNNMNKNDNNYLKT